MLELAELWSFVGSEANTLRRRLSRFVRKTLSFSKCERMHEVTLCLFVHHYNLSLTL